MLALDNNSAHSIWNLINNKKISTWLRWLELIDKKKRNENKEIEDWLLRILELKIIFEMLLCWLLVLKDSISLFFIIKLSVFYYLISFYCFFFFSHLHLTHVFILPINSLLSQRYGKYRLIKKLKIYIIHKSFFRLFY